jgi:anti-sigma28 factor (negative regulator of flagellin synthesis)
MRSKTGKDLNIMDMRVGSVYKAYQPYSASKTQKIGCAERIPGKRDVFTPSVQAEDYNLVRQALSAVPDIRADRVSNILAQMEAGQYAVTTDALAESILCGMDRLA